jgi:CheY-like chemotaxis protein
MTRRIIIIDDDKAFCRMIQKTFEDVLGYRADYTDNETEMLEMIRKAEEANDPYQIATIDMNFRMQGSEYEFPQGHQILATIKAKYPYLLCIMISGSGVTPSQVLMLRDNHDLDFFITKSRLEPVVFKMAVEHITERAKSKPQAAKTPAPKSQADSPSVFISYRRMNTWGKARAIANSLREHHVDVFLDVDSIGSGSFPPYILKAIVERDYFILLLAPETLDSEWVQKEIQYALEMEKTIIPVLLDGFQMNETTIPADFTGLLKYNGIEVTAKSYQGDIERLVNQYLRNH